LYYGLVNRLEVMWQKTSEIQPLTSSTLHWRFTTWATQIIMNNSAICSWIAISVDTHVFEVLLSKNMQ